MRVETNMKSEISSIREVLGRLDRGGTGAITFEDFCAFVDSTAICTSDKDKHSMFEHIKDEEQGNVVNRSLMIRWLSTHRSSEEQGINEDEEEDDEQQTCCTLQSLIRSAFYIPKGTATHVDKGLIQNIDDLSTVLDIVEQQACVLFDNNNGCELLRAIDNERECIRALMQCGSASMLRHNAELIEMYREKGRSPSQSQLMFGSEIEIMDGDFTDDCETMSEASDLSGMSAASSLPTFLTLCRQTARSTHAT